MKPTLKQLSDCEQIEAKIESAYRKFAEDMRKIDENHARFMRRFDWWDAFAQGAIVGGAAVFVVAFVLILISKHK